MPRNGRDQGNSGHLNRTSPHTVAFSPGLVGKDGREVLQGAALGVERVHLSVTDPVDIALKLCFNKELKRRFFFALTRLFTASNRTQSLYHRMEFCHSEGIMQPGSAVQVFTHGRWREATVEASEEGAFAVLHAGDNQISAGCENIPHGSDKIRWPNAPPRTCSWSNISDLEESCPPVLLKATSELQPASGSLSCTAPYTADWTELLPATRWCRDRFLLMIRDALGNFEDMEETSEQIVKDEILEVLTRRFTLGGRGCSRNPKSIGYHVTCVADGSSRCGKESHIREWIVSKLRVRRSQFVHCNNSPML